MEPKAKLPDRSNLDAGRSLLSAKIKEYVPDTTTAQEWCKCFESFCGDEPHSAALFSDFCAMVYFRTTIPKGQPGRLEVSSVCTYLRYVVLKYKKYSVLPCFKAIETEAGSLGSQRKAPSACGEHLAKVQHWLQKGPAAKLKLRSAAWMQTTTGGRSIDVNRLRGGGLILENRQVKSVDWKWTKSIKRPSDAKTVFPPRPIRDAVGPAPFTAAQWKLWSGQDGMARPFATFTSAEVNDELEATWSTGMRAINGSERLRLNPVACGLGHFGDEVENVTSEDVEEEDCRQLASSVERLMRSTAL